jgi:hypothetical protein
MAAGSVKPVATTRNGLSYRTGVESSGAGSIDTIAKPLIRSRVARA